VRDTNPAGPGVILLDRKDGTIAANEAARRWLEELSPERMAVHEVASATRAGRGAESYLRVRSSTGQWLSIWGSIMDGDTGNDGVSIVIQPAPTSDIARILSLAYGLSPREQQVLQLVISGTASAAIAAQLQVSPHTVQSHLKSLFAKFAVKSRGQLVSKIVGDLYNV
jgi:DNA-binding CsgD family transcriptional regulator